MDIEIKNLVYQLLPPHKRLPVRIHWLCSLLSPLMDLWITFHAWRKNLRMMVNVNSQLMVLTGYLQNKYHESIQIASYKDGLLWVPLLNEASLESGAFPVFGHSDTGKDLQGVPLLNEIRERFGDTDFIVYIPASVSLPLVEAEIEKYRQALIKYQIIQNE